MKITPATGLTFERVGAGVVVTVEETVQYDLDAAAVLRVSDFFNAVTLGSDESDETEE